MAAIHELIAQIQDPELRQRIQKETDKLLKQKKFGLVFEEHLPECTPLYDVPVCKGSKVSRKNGRVSDLFTVIDISDGKAICLPAGQTETVEFDLSDLVATAEFGEPIYPYLQKLETVCNAPESDLWHTLIQADNYHALQLLEYLYTGKVDCIYIDPPYNTGARDWKYNNDYVDSSDSYRHSKWLSMMQRRLRIAKRLLNPENSVLIVTIDEKEYHHLGCLLEELFPEARIQMVSVTIHAAGIARSEFSRTDEYYFFIFIGDSSPLALQLGEDWKTDGTKRQDSVRWESLLRSGNNGRRIDRPNLFYPVLFDAKTHDFRGFGDSIPIDVPGSEYEAPDGMIAVLPYASDGSEACWRISSAKILQLKKLGAFDWGEFRGNKTTLKYLKPGELQKVNSGDYKVTGYKNNGAMIISSDSYQAKWIPGTQWHVNTHQAGGQAGSVLIKNIFLTKRFDFPKSLYAVHDAIRFFVANKPNALILDFFAGSGTTLHAVNLLNAEDGGKRRCILVTNNEVSDDEAKSLRARGHHPGDREWEELGIAQYVTWPRTVCSIEGHDVNGNPLKGNYLGSDRPMADGFASNAIFFKLGFLDKTSVARGKQFKELLPLLWLKAGAHQSCPELPGEVPNLLLFPRNRFAVLLKESAFSELERELATHPEIETVYLVTDYEPGYRAMAKQLSGKTTYQLYRDYLDNFRINTERNLS